MFFIRGKNCDIVTSKVNFTFWLLNEINLFCYSCNFYLTGIYRMNTGKWFCDLCGRTFSKPHLVEKHKRTANGECRVDVFLSIHADEAWNRKLRQFHDDKANLSVGTRRKSKGLNCKRF